MERTNSENMLAEEEEAVPTTTMGKIKRRLRKLKDSEVFRQTRADKKLQEFIDINPMYPFKELPDGSAYIEMYCRPLKAASQVEGFSFCGLPWTKSRQLLTTVFLPQRHSFSKSLGWP
jgi:hypothetical protein